MTHVLEAKAPTGTHTIQRRWENTETPKQIVGMKQPPQSKLSEWDMLAPQVGILRFVSGDKEHSTAPSRVGAFLLSSTQDQADAIFEAPGADLSARLRRALPVIAPMAQDEDVLLAKVVEWLLSRSIVIAPQRVPSFPSTQLELSADKWMAQVRAWARSHPQRDHVVDDSRESIYGDRV